MCSVAPPAALGFDATAFLDQRRGVAAVAPVACGVMARKPVRRVGAVASSTQKRSRDGFDGKIRDREGFAAGEVSVIPAPGQQRLQERMMAELDAIRVLHRKAVLLSGGAARASKSKHDARFLAAGTRTVVAPTEVAAKRKMMSPSKPAPEAVKQTTEPAKQQQQRPVKRATPPPTKRLVAKPVDKALEILKRRRLEKIAQARERCREEVLEMERTALPDETVYPQDLQELGIAFQYAVTRTRRQAESSRLNGGE
ncbi:hypothetical protein BAE44_0024806 [Dichanthelium oligosanthes]|uniref:Uncharacterized protein n=1 Tax=Dichanthelium oligosanthes TaxID=888268 RepID=A0A1E5UN10_9POAL|nr:hypothetical protein BAE44_0024806 [Dichanthelium oligosanthes]